MAVALAWRLPATAVGWRSQYVSTVENPLFLSFVQLVFLWHANARRARQASPSLSQSLHCEFLEYWNTQKSVWRIWQHFSCLLDEGIPKIWKKLNCHSCFLRADLGSAKMCYQMGWIGCAILQVAKKAIMRIPFLSYFWNPNPLIKKCSQILQTLISIL